MHVCYFLNSHSNKSHNLEHLWGLVLHMDVQHCDSKSHSFFFFFEKLSWMLKSMTLVVADYYYKVQFDFFFFFFPPLNTWLTCGETRLYEKQTNKQKTCMLGVLCYFLMYIFFKLCQLYFKIRMIDVVWALFNVAWQIDILYISLYISSALLVIVTTLRTWMITSSYVERCSTTYRNV